MNIFTRLCHHFGITDLLRNQRMFRQQQARALAHYTREVFRPRTLADVEWSCYSQWGEDGILDWLVEQLPDIPKTFVELGCGDYEECNTRCLMELRNWSGVVVDANPAAIAHIQVQDYYWRYDLTAKCLTVTPAQYIGVPNEVGVLSIDLDGMDYWVWDAILWRPWVVICEYNDLFGARAVTVPYQENFNRTKAHYSNLYFGASLSAMCKLATRKGYVFLGTNINGCNAFFVREDKASFIKLGEAKAWPARFREARDAQGCLIYASRDVQRAMIAHLPLEEVS